MVDNRVDTVPISAPFVPVTRATELTVQRPEDRSSVTLDELKGYERQGLPITPRMLTMLDDPENNPERTLFELSTDVAAVRALIQIVLTTNTDPQLEREGTRLSTGEVTDEDQRRGKAGFGRPTVIFPGVADVDMWLKESRGIDPEAFLNNKYGVTIVEAQRALTELVRSAAKEDQKPEVTWERISKEADFPHNIIVGAFQPRLNAMNRRMGTRRQEGKAHMAIEARDIFHPIIWDILTGHNFSSVTGPALTKEETMANMYRERIQMLNGRIAKLEQGK